MTETTNTENNKTIVIIEDEHDLRFVYTEMLTDAGYHVEGAGDGQAGMDLLKTIKWDALLLDIMLPGKDGLKILKELKANPEFKKGPVITLTNLNSEQIIRECINAGADGYLIKSEITPDKIVNEVQNILGK
jgi:two-component system, chemotaxis family, chemotaxis protein CheY